MPIRLASEEFIGKSIAKFGKVLDYSLVNYRNSKTPVRLICPIHGAFEQKPNTHLNAKLPCPKCSCGVMSTGQFIEKSKIKYGDRFDYSKVNYISYYEKIEVICKEHGPFLVLSPDHFRGCSGGCPKCSITKLLTTEEFIERSMRIHGHKYNYSKVNYINQTKKIIIICPEHGEFEQLPNNHYHYGCLKCSGNYLKSNEEFILECKIAHKNKFDYSKTQYSGMFQKIIVICSEHGEFNTLATNHLHGKRGCPKCSKRISKNEILWLDGLGIPNDKKHRNVFIKIDKKKYFVDGFDPKSNTIYEFDGDYWHGNPAIYDQNNINPEAGLTFGALYKRTLRKQSHLKSAGYNFVSIWESDFVKDSH